MNKYQEALETIKTYYDNFKGASIGFMFEKEISLLQELVDKEKPMKPLYDSTARSKRYKYLCPNENCRGYLFEANSQTMRLIGHEEKYSHCAYCGQKLDWSDINE